MYAQALQYIDAHLAELTANENMPLILKITLNLRLRFILKLDAFTAAKITAAEGTDLKIDANNSIYEKVIDKILKWGKKYLQTMILNAVSLV